MMVTHKNLEHGAKRFVKPAAGCGRNIGRPVALFTMLQREDQTMQLTIRITCDNAAFEDDPIGEIERVLKQLVFRLGDDRYAFQRGTSGKLSIPTATRSETSCSTCRGRTGRTGRTRETPRTSIDPPALPH